MTLRAPAAQILVAVALGIAVRAPFWREALRTPLDGDTAVIGLMARHPGHGTTMWGQPYGSPIEAWLAAPLAAASGSPAAALRIFYFALGLGLIPAAWLLAASLHPAAALPVAVLIALAPPYWLLLAAMPPPMYPLALLLCALVLALALRIAPRLEAGGRPMAALASWGTLAGLALWTHLMSAAPVAAAAAYLVRRAPRRRLLIAAAVPLLLASAPLSLGLLAEPLAARAVGPVSRDRSAAAHFATTLGSLHVPLGGLLGTHVPLIADDPDHVIRAPVAARVGLILIYCVGAVLAVAASRRNPAARLLLLSAALSLIAFPFALRSGPAAIRFLTPMYLPLAVATVWATLARAGPRRTWLLVLALGCLHLTGGVRLLAAWRAADRAAAPFLLPDLAPLRRFLESRGIRRVYCSYGPAYRLTFESGEWLIASQPWNERFLHFPLPYLDEVRFARDAAWVLTPKIPTELPSPDAFESALRAIGGVWRRTPVGDAVVFHGFVPPFAPDVEPLATAGAAGDGDLSTRLEPDRTTPTVFTLSPPRPLDAVTLAGPGLLRSMDVEVSADGATFDVAARRRRREERSDLRWANGHPQYVVDDDFLAIPLGGRLVAAVRITPVASGDPWSLAEVLLHPARETRRQRWDDWLPPDLDWPGRYRALVESPRRDREDWYFRLLIASRHAR
ncbi:MAG TPA: hypothetical protein VGL15_06115 [Vicinamibacteria bacterium]